MPFLSDTFVGSSEGRKGYRIQQNKGQGLIVCKTPVTGGLLPVTEASKGRISISTFSFVILEERHIFVPSLRGLLIV